MSHNQEWEDKEVTEEARVLAHIFQQNRVKHGSYWEKIWAHRVEKVIWGSEAHPEWVNRVVNRAVDLGLLEYCEKLEKETGKLKPALKLVKFNYQPSR